MNRTMALPTVVEDYCGDCSDPSYENNGVQPIRSYVHWTTSDSRIFVPAAKTVPALVPGAYEIKASPELGVYFERIPVKTEGLLRLSDTNSDKVVGEIQKFWERESIFKEYRLTYKRGILLYGPPGSGKSCTIQIIMEDVVARKGIVIRFTQPQLFLEGMRILRQIQPTIPAVVIMEDIDSIIQIYSESEVLNLLDGVNEVEKVVFLATTNYPEQLGGRIVNRPSRFDKRFRIGYPTAKSRRAYFEFLIGRGDEDVLKSKVKELKIDLKRWVSDTDEMSIAHLKELFVAVVVLGDEYKEAIETLQTMKENLKDKDFDTDFGFKTERGCDYYN